MNDFLCPKCRGHLRIGNEIILLAKNSRKKSGLILLNAEVGNYNSTKHPSFDVREGEDFDFYCPLCHTDLKSDIHLNLAKVIMIDENSSEFEVYFSRIAGEHSTYATKGDTLRISGEHAGKYTYFKIGKKFRKYL